MQVPSLAAWLAISLTAGVAPSQERVESATVLESTFTEADGPLASPALDALEGTVRGRAFLLDADFEGPLTVELIGCTFDCYLIVRDAEGQVVAEDDDGLRPFFCSFVVFDATVGSSYTVEAGFWEGGEPGPFRLSISPGDLSAELGGLKTERELEQVRWRNRTAAAAGLPPLPRTQLLNMEARLAGDLGDHAAAAKTFLSSAAIAEAELGPNHRSIAFGLASAANSLAAINRHAEAIEHRRRAVELFIATDGPLSPAVIELIGAQGFALYRLGDFSGAALAYADRLERLELVEPPDTAELVRTRINLGVNLNATGAANEARTVLEAAIAMERGAPSPDPVRLAWGLHELGSTLADAARAERALDEAYGLRTEHLGAAAPETLASLSGRGGRRADQRRWAEARADLERALELQNASVGADHVDSLGTRQRLARLNLAQRPSQAAVDDVLSMVAAYAASASVSTSERWTALCNAAATLLAAARHGEAADLARRALDLAEAAFGAGDHRVATSLELLASVCLREGERKQGLELAERAAAILWAADPPRVDDALAVEWVLGDALIQLGRTEEAVARVDELLSATPLVPGRRADELLELDYLRAKARARAGAFDDAWEAYVRILNAADSEPRRRALSRAVRSGLADLATDTGRFREARKAVETLLDMSIRDAGPDAVDTARIRGRLADLLNRLGETERAIELGARGVRDLEVAMGHDHPWTVAALSNHGAALAEIDPAAAHAASREALERAGRRGDLRPDELLTLRHNAANVGRHVIGVEAALAEMGAVRVELEELATHDSLKVARMLATEAQVLGEAQRWAEARPLLERSVAVHLDTLGAFHPLTVATRSTLTEALTGVDQLDEARAVAREAVTGALEHSAVLLPALDEPEALRYLARLARPFHLLLELGTEATASADHDLVLAWKGRVGRAGIASRRISSTAADPELQARVDDLLSVQRRLGAAFARAERDPFASNNDLEELLVERKRVERELRESLPAAALGAAPTSADVARALPPGTVAIDFVFRTEGGPERAAGSRTRVVTAWVLAPDRDGPIRVELGAAEPVEAAVEALLARFAAEEGGAARDRDSGPDPSPSRAIRELLWAPLAPHVDGATRIVLAPDGPLAALPFEVIELEPDRFLVEEFAVEYATDLARWTEPRSEVDPGTASLLAVGGVTFAGTRAAREHVLRSVPSSVAETSWAALPGSELEVEGIVALHRDRFGDGGERTLLRGAAPTEQRVREELSRHRVAHLATHGFLREPRAAGGDLLRAAEDRPGLLSGLVLAPPTDDAALDDGFLTAEEIGWLELDELELVVLSACDTGLGRAAAGEGLLGLRRAFELSGARHVAAASWPVPDLETALLMRAFYAELWKRDRRPAEALRAAQLALLAANRATRGEGHPESWGAWILTSRGG